VLVILFSEHRVVSKMLRPFYEFVTSEAKRFRRIAAFPETHQKGVMHHGNKLFETAFALASDWAGRGAIGSDGLQQPIGPNRIIRRSKGFSVGNNPVSAAVTSIETAQDLAVANNGSNNVSVLLGNRDGTFQGPRNFPAATAPVSVAVGDFNGDGVQDLVVANNGSDNGSVLLGNGDGSFQPPLNFAVGKCPSIRGRGRLQW